MEESDKQQTIETMIQLIEGSRKAYQIMSYLFAFAVSGLLATINALINSTDSIMTNYLGASVFMLLLSHAGFKSKIEPKFKAAIQAMRLKKESEPVDADNQITRP